MKEAKKKEKVTLELTEFISESGEVVKIEEEELSKLLEDAIYRKEKILKQKCENLDKIYDFNNLDGKTPRDRASTIFFGKFFIEYSGNPSMNGGNFYYESYDVERKREHLYFDNEPTCGEGYQYRILSGLACDNYFRWFGYGVHQAGFKFWHEDEGTAKEFIKYIKNDSLISLTDKTVGHSSGFSRDIEEFDQNVGAGLFWYCLRSRYFEGAKEFRGYVSQEMIDRRARTTLNDLYDYIKDGYEETFDENDDWRPYLMNKANVIKAIVGDGKFPHDEDGRTKERMKEIADSWINKRLDIIDNKTLEMK